MALNRMPIRRWPAESVKIEMKCDEVIRIVHLEEGILPVNLDSFPAIQPICHNFLGRPHWPQSTCCLSMWRMRKRCAYRVWRQCLLVRIFQHLDVLLTNLSNSRRLDRDGLQDIQ